MIGFVGLKKGRVDCVWVKSEGAAAMSGGAGGGVVVLVILVWVYCL